MAPNKGSVFTYISCSNITVCKLLNFENVAQKKILLLTSALPNFKGLQLPQWHHSPYEISMPTNLTLLYPSVM